MAFFKEKTHKSIQKKEDSVKNSGSGQPDADFPKKPESDCFYKGVKREIY